MNGQTPGCVMAVVIETVIVDADQAAFPSVIAL
jgi:hypothetical protein